MPGSDLPPVTVALEIIDNCPRYRISSTQLTITFTLPPDVAGGSSAGTPTNEGQNLG